jgi:hypothetical protein
MTHAQNGEERGGKSQKKTAHEIWPTAFYDRTKPWGRERRRTCPSAIISPPPEINARASAITDTHKSHSRQRVFFSLPRPWKEKRKKLSCEDEGPSPSSEFYVSVSDSSVRKKKNETENIRVHVDNDGGRGSRVIGLKSGRHTNVRKKGNGKNVKREIEKEIEEIEEEELFINATKSCSWLVSLFGDILIRLFNPEEKRRKKK